MYTAKITNKEEVNGQFVVTVEFTDGVDTVTETVVPQDKQGFIHWVKQRSYSLTTAKELKDEDNVGKVVDVTTTQLTQSELDFNEWVEDFNRLKQVQELVDLGVVVDDNPKLVALRNKVQNDLKAEYVDKL